MMQSKPCGSSEDAHSTPTSRQVISIPELATLVAGFSTRRDCVRLLQTCNFLYKLATPFVWGHVDGAKHLLLLIDRAFRKTDHSNPEGIPEICLKNGFGGNNPFQRFDFYGSHVKHLDVYGSKDEMFKVTGWKLLISRAQRQVLLPNLHTLTIQTSHAGSSGPDQPMWVGTFSSPSLVNLLITPSNLPEPSTVSFLEASFIMKSLVAHRPKLERLGLFPNPDDGRDEDEGGSSLLAFLSGEPFYTYVEDMASLRHLTCNLAWFDIPSLQILGRLPHLETITVCSEVGEMRGWSSVLPHDTFPSLRSLSLHQLNAFDIADILRTTQMTKNLTSLDARLNVSILVEDEDFDHVSWLVGQFFPLLLNAPRLANLRIDADPRGDADDYFRIDGSVLGICQRLPLKTLHLGDIYFDDEVLDLDLASVWPLVTRLDIPRQLAPLTTISRFAAIPGLQHLELGLELRKPTLEYHSSPSPLAELSASPISDIIYSGFKDMDLIARALLDIFPNLIHVAWPKPEGEITSESRLASAGCADFVNGHLATLREVRELRRALQS